MKQSRKEKTLIGRAEKIYFPTLGNEVLYARIDTGAKTSSIWATEIKETDKGLLVRFTSPDYAIYAHEMEFTHFTKVIIASSMGHQQVRYKVKLPIIIHKRKIMASFTLSDRSTQVYPVLLGRATLTGKFIVDVSKGSILKDEEAARSEALQAGLIEENV